MYSAKPQDEPTSYKRELRCTICNKKYAVHYKAFVVLKCEQCHQLSVLDTDDKYGV